MRTAVLSFLLAILMGLAATVGAAQVAVGPFFEKDGIVVVEMEALDTTGTAWPRETSLGGYTGQGYIRFNGNSNFNNPPNTDILEYRFRVTNPGTYNMRIRGQKNASASDADNDSFIKMQGINNNNWTKFFTSLGSGSWHWTTPLEPHHGSFINLPKVTLAAGDHVFYITGRSKNHKIDRIVFFLDGVNEATALSAPMSLLEPPTPPEPTSWTLDFRKQNTNGFTAGAAGTLIAATALPTDRGLCLRGPANANGVAFGFWSGSIPNFQLKEGKVYEIDFIVSTDADENTRRELPQFRARVNDSSFQSGLTYNIDSEGNLELVPTTGGKRVRMYYFTPNEVAGNNLILSFDWLFAPGSGNRSDMAFYVSEIKVTELGDE